MTSWDFVPTDVADALRSLVVRDVQFVEDDGPLVGFVRGLVSDYEPATRQDWAYVVSAAGGYWQLRRVHRAQSRRVADKVGGLVRSSARKKPTGRRSAPSLDDLGAPDDGDSGEAVTLERREPTLVRDVSRDRLDQLNRWVQEIPKLSARRMRDHPAVEEFVAHAHWRLLRKRDLTAKAWLRQADLRSIGRDRGPCVDYLECERERVHSELVAGEHLLGELNRAAPPTTSELSALKHFECQLQKALDALAASHEKRTKSEQSRTRT